MLLTCLRFYLGQAEAIRRLAATPWLWLAALPLVLSAGLAREYDAEDLTAEPWHLAIAPVVSFVAATLLWLLVQLTGLGRWEHKPRAGVSYRAFLGLFMLTAPMAWLYGIPYERFLGAGEAASWNLWTLALVALWRVVLMIRVVTVLYRVPFGIAAVVVLLFGNALLLLAVHTIPVNLFAFMGGVRLGPADAVLANAVFLVMMLGPLSLFVLALTFLVTFRMRHERWAWNGEAAALTSKPLIWLGLAACVWWCAWLPWTQPEQRLRHRVESALLSGNIPEGLRVTIGRQPADFPPHWDPPPRMGGKRPKPETVLIAMTAVPVPTWVRLCYEDKICPYRTTTEDAMALLEQLTDADRLMNKFRNRLETELAREATTQEMRTRITALLERHPNKQP